MVGFASGFAEVVGGAAEMEAGKFTRKAMNLNALHRERDGVAEAGRVRDVSRLHIGRQVAGLASSGFTLSGSATDALKESMLERELEIAAIRRRSASEASSLRTQGDIAYATGYNRMTASMISGAAKIYDAATTDYAAAAGGG